jgi:hypothetical protein
MERFIYRDEIMAALRELPVVALLGARQVGKTTISREIAANYRFDLENLRDLAKFENPQILLEDVSGVVVIDEIQRKPEIFPLLRYLVDRPGNRSKFLILGSASRDLIRQSSETVPGRIHCISVQGFSLAEIDHPEKKWSRLWVRGSYPLAYLARSEESSYRWREQYITTFLERDIPQLGISIPSKTLRRFWIMLSHYHGQILNYSELAKSFGISDMTVRKYLDILSGTFMVRILEPWYENTGKRVTKQPKLYLSDSGIFHTLQSIENGSQLESHPKLGASFEGFVVNQIISVLRKSGENFFFYRTHQGTEIDLFWLQGGKRWGLEAKYADAPVMTKSMRIAIEDLGLEKLWVVYPGKEDYDLDKKVRVISVAGLVNFFGRTTERSSRR